MDYQQGQLVMVEVDLSGSSQGDLLRAMARSPFRDIIYNSPKNRFSNIEGTVSVTIPWITKWHPGLKSTIREAFEDPEIDFNLVVVRIIDLVDEEELATA